MNLDNGATFLVALVACILGGLALIVLVQIARRLPPKQSRPEFGSGSYRIPTAPFVSQQASREDHAGSYRACDAPTRRVSVVDGLDPLPFCERCGQRVRRLDA